MNGEAELLAVELLGWIIWDQIDGELQPPELVFLHDSPNKPVRPTAHYIQPIFTAVFTPGTKEASDEQAHEG